MFAPVLPMLAKSLQAIARNCLAILPDLSHCEIFFATAMAGAMLPFLDGESGSKSWADQVRGSRSSRRLAAENVARIQID
jgi:hypothetical protein